MPDTPVKKKLIGIVSPPYEDQTLGKKDNKEKALMKEWIIKGGINFMDKEYGNTTGQIGKLKTRQPQSETFDITQFHSCNDSLYWHGCYGSDTAFKKYVTPESYAHPAKASFLLMDRIFKHLKILGLLNKGDTICDFMAGSGRTNIVASLHGFDSVAVELEPHFIKMIQDNIALAKKQINRNVNVQIVQGDSRKLSEILGKANIGIVSPPYQDAMSSEKHGINMDKLAKTSRSWGKSSQVEIENRYSSNPSNIGNLKDSALVGITSPPYGLGEGIGHSGQPTKMVKAVGLANKIRYGNTKGNIGNLKDKKLIGITSPPYESADNMFHDISWMNKVRPRPSNPTIISEVKNNIESQRGESYLSAMLQVYREAAKVMPVLVTVTKDPTRKGQLRRLDLDTAKLLQLAGYRIVDYHRAVLFDERKQLTLKGSIRKELKGRLSFFKRLSISKGNLAAKFEDILFAVKA